MNRKLPAVIADLIRERLKDNPAISESEQTIAIIELASRVGGGISSSEAETFIEDAELITDRMINRTVGQLIDEKKLDPHDADRFIMEVKQQLAVLLAGSLCSCKKTLIYGGLATAGGLAAAFAIRSVIEGKKQPH